MVHEPVLDGGRGVQDRGAVGVGPDPLAAPSGVFGEQPGRQGALTEPPGELMWSAMSRSGAAYSRCRSRVIASSDAISSIRVTQARAEPADLVNRVVYGGGRVVVTRHGKPLVALVSAADPDVLEGAERPEEERVVRSVSGFHSLDSVPGEQGHFGLAARHHEPGAPRWSPPVG